MTLCFLVFEICPTRFAIIKRVCYINAFVFILQSGPLRGQTRHGKTGGGEGDPDGTSFGYIAYTDRSDINGVESGDAEAVIFRGDTELRGSEP